MAQEVLVDLDVKAGEEVLRILDEAGFPVAAALWAQTDYYEDWRLFVFSPAYDRTNGDATLEMVKAFPPDSRYLIQDVRLTLNGTRSQFLRDLRQRFRKRENVTGRRVRAQRFGEVWVEDSYIYRLY